MEYDSNISDGSLNIKESKKGFIQEALSGFKVALMGTLFVMAKDSSLSFKMNLFGMIIDLLQMLAFTFNLGSVYPWNEAYSSWFSMLCFYSKLEFYISESNPTQNLIIYLICVSLVFFNLINVGIVGYRFVKKKVQNVFLLKILRSVASLLTTVFYMPFLSQFMIMFSCAIGRLNFEGCPLSQKWLLIIASPLISITFGLLSLIVASSFYEQDYTSDDVSARPHARVELFYLVLKGVMTVFYSLFDAPDYHYWQIFMILSVGFPVTICYIYYLPFYHYTTTVIQAQFTGIFTWSGVCLLLCRIENNPDDAGPIMLFYLGIPCICVLVKDACDLRRQQLSEKQIEDIKNPYEVELRTRFWMLNQVGNYKTKDEEILTQVEDFYYLAERKFPSSSILQLFVAQFHLTYRDRQEAIPKLEQAEKRNPALDEQFIIYKTRQSVGKDAIVFVTFSSYLESAHRAEIAALSAQYDFWNELQKSDGLSYTKLTRLAGIITKNIDVAGNYYKYLMTIDRTHRKMLPMYVNFLEDVMLCDDYEVKNLRNRVQDMRENEEIIRSNPFSVDLSCLPEFVISLDKASFALIEQVSAEMIGWLQKPKASLINQSLTLLMPEYLRESFKNFLLEIKEIYNETHLLHEIELNLLDKDGFLMCGNCKMTYLVNEQKPTTAIEASDISSVASPVKSIRSNVISTMQGQRNDIFNKKLLCKLLPNTTNNPVMMVSKAFKILHVNRDATYIFGTNFELEASYDIRDIIPNFENLLKNILKRSTIMADYMEILTPIQTFVLSKTNEFLRIKLFAKTIKTSLGKVYLIELQKLGSYSRQTQRFFRFFIGFLETYIRGVYPALFRKTSIRELLDDQGDSEPEEVSDVKSLMKHVEKQVEQKNKSFSPELQKVKHWILVFSLLMITCFVIGYVIAMHLFDQYTGNLLDIKNFNEAQKQSQKMSELARIMDIHRQGLPLPLELEYYTTDIQETIVVLDDLAEKVRANHDIEGMNSLNVPCISYNYLEGYKLTNKTRVDALKTLISYAQKLVDGPLEDWNIANNSFAFWVYQNGLYSLPEALISVNDIRLEDLDKDTDEIIMYAWVMAVAESVLCLIAIALSFPLMMKSNKTFQQIFAVFVSIPAYLLKYLTESTYNSLNMRKDSKYPDCRSKYKTQQEIWEDNVFERGKRTAGKTNLTLNSQGLLARILSVVRQHLSKRILLYISISLVFIFVLQTWYGQIYVLGLLSKSGVTVRSIGHLDKIIHIVNIKMMNTALSPYEAEVKNKTEEIRASIDYDKFTLDNMEESFQSSLDNTTLMRRYMKMFLLGDSALGIGYSYIYPIQKDHFFSTFFQLTCRDIGVCATEKEPVMSYVQMVSYFTFEVESICYQIFNSEEMSPEDRWGMVSAQTFKILVRESELSSLGQNIEEKVIGYYTDILDNYNINRTVILVCFCFLTLTYYFFIVRKSLIISAKKEQLTRSMLLLLPERIVIQSAYIQRALFNINFD